MTELFEGLPFFNGDQAKEGVEAATPTVPHDDHDFFENVVS